MSHTIRKVNLGNTALAEITIIDYTLGGETFTLAELGLTGSVLAVFLIPMKSLLGTPQDLIPSLSGGVVKLMVPCGSTNTEVPTTVGLNYTFLALVNGT